MLLHSKSACIGFFFQREKIQHPSYFPQPLQLKISISYVGARYLQGPYKKPALFSPHLKKFKP